MSYTTYTQKGHCAINLLFYNHWESQILSETQILSTSLAPSWHWVWEYSYWIRNMKWASEISIQDLGPWDYTLYYTFCIWLINWLVIHSEQWYVWTDDNHTDAQFVQLPCLYLSIVLQCHKSILLSSIWLSVMPEIYQPVRQWLKNQPIGCSIYRLQQPNLV